MEALTKQRQDSLAAMLESPSPAAQRAVQEMIRKGGPEGDYLSKLVSHHRAGKKDVPDNKALRPVQSK